MWGVLINHRTLRMFEDRTLASWFNNQQLLRSLDDRYNSLELVHAALLFTLETVF